MLNLFENKEVLLTGGSGFIGSHLARTLVSMGANVTCLVRETTDIWRLSGIESEMTFRSVDTSIPSTISDGVHQVQPHYVFHCYGSPQKLDSIGFSASIAESSVMLTKLLEACQSLATSRLKAIVHLCGSTIYQQAGTEGVLTEHSPMIPASWRGLIKLNERNICLRYLDKGLPVKIGRIFRAYGPGEVPNSRNTKLLAQVLECMRTNQPVQLGDNSFKRDYIFLEDITSALLLMCKKEVPNGTEVNLCSGESYGPGDIVALLEELLEREIEKVPVEYPKNDYDRGDFKGDRSLAKELLGWEPSFDIRFGLSEVIKWYESYYACSLR